VPLEGIRTLTEEKAMEEGDKCKNPGCAGTMVYGEVENCSCHISPPCGNCINNPLGCDTCGCEEGDYENY